ncbi:GNAT family N-acetyltransferase [Microbispora sp. NPDC049125]|uniref:GNAT family N-acetyltransferase n=1 Tax=Microbispora sp. NPDC049125 TaxID=3154929 RepID=UPI003466413B
MSDIEVHPATEERWDDLRAVLSSGSVSKGCWCLAWRVSSGEFVKASARQREQRMHALVAGDPPPGVLAYRDGEPVGWCNAGPRAGMARLARSRTIPAVDDLPVWAVVCFVVRTGHRRQGVAEHLLRGAVDLARAHGAPAVEGFPVDPGGGRVDTTSAYVGTTGMFERAGFHRVAETAATSGRRPRWLMRLDCAV